MVTNGNRKLNIYTYHLPYVKAEVTSHTISVVTHTIKGIVMHAVKGMLYTHNNSNQQCDGIVRERLCSERASNCP